LHHVGPEELRARDHRPCARRSGSAVTTGTWRRAYAGSRREPTASPGRCPTRFGGDAAEHGPGVSAACDFLVVSSEASQTFRQVCADANFASAAVRRKPADAAGPMADGTKVRVDGRCDEGAGGLGWPGPPPSWGKAGVHKCEPTAVLRGRGSRSLWRTLREPGSPSQAPSGGWAGHRHARPPTFVFRRHCPVRRRGSLRRCCERRAIEGRIAPPQRGERSGGVARLSTTIARRPGHTHPGGQAWRCPVVYMRERSLPSQRWWSPLAPLRAAAGWTSPAPRATVVADGTVAIGDDGRSTGGDDGIGASDGNSESSDRAATAAAESSDRAAVARCRRAAGATPASRCGATSTRPVPEDRPRR
jgi:hypothetical protein